MFFILLLYKINTNARTITINIKYHYYKIITIIYCRISNIVDYNKNK